MIDLSIIIVNYNVKGLLENCINSILNSSKNYNVEIIIVDNNSYDGSVQYIESKFNSYKNIKVISNNTNLGFAKANNLGVSYAKGNYLLILNPDTLLQEDTIDKCIRYFQTDNKIGALTCKLILPNGKLDVACRRSFPNTHVAFYRMVGFSKLFPKSKIFGKYNLTYLDENSTYEVDAICGAFMLIKKELYDHIDGFDEDYFMYGEDLDICYRIKKLGYIIIYYAGTSVIHYKGESTKKSSISYISNFYGAMRIFVEKNLHKSSNLLNLFIKVLILYRAALSYIYRFVKVIHPLLLDLIMILTSMLISIKLRFEFFPIEEYSLVIVFYSVIWLISLSLSGTYKKSNRLSFIKPLNGILIGFFVNSSFTYFFNEFAFSRVVVLRTTAYAYILLFSWRFILRLISFFKQKNLFYNLGNTLIIGKNSESESFVKKLKTRVDSDYNVLGYVSKNGDYSEAGYIANINNLIEVINVNNVKNLIFAKSELSNQQILDLMWKLREYNLNYKILSSESDIILGKTASDKIDELFLIPIEYNINKKINIFGKRLFDLVFGILCLCIIYPWIFIYVKLFNPNLNNLKFYSKVLLIPLVIIGKLSFVGRPIWDNTSINNYTQGKRGLTGLVQINYYKNLNSEDIEYYNNYYAKNQNISLDLEIIFKTFSLFIFKNKIIRL